MTRAPIPSPVPCTSWNTACPVGDATIYAVLRKLLRGPLPVIRGRPKTFVEGPVDYTDLRTEFIGLIYEGLARLPAETHGREDRPPGLPQPRSGTRPAAARGWKTCWRTTRRAQGSADHAAEGKGHGQRRRARKRKPRTRKPRNRRKPRRTIDEEVVEVEAEAARRQDSGPVITSTPWSRRNAGPGKRWCWPGLVGKQGKKESDSEYQARIEAEATRLINRVVGHRRVLPGPGRQHPQGDGHFLHPPATGRADRPPHVGAALLRQGRGWHADPKDARDNPRAQSLRSGVRQCLVPGGRTALLDRSPLQVALPSPQPGRPGAGQADHAPLWPCPNWRS